jgi:hypothetical protein
MPRCPTWLAVKTHHKSGHFSSSNWTGPDLGTRSAPTGMAPHIGGRQSLPYKNFGETPRRFPVMELDRTGFWGPTESLAALRTGRWDAFQNPDNTPSSNWTGPDFFGSANTRAVQRARRTWPSARDNFILSCGRPERPAAFSTTVETTRGINSPRRPGQRVAAPLLSKLFRTSSRAAMPILWRFGMSSR